MPVIRKRQFEHTITIDGQPVRLLLKRLTVPEYAEFVSMLSAYGQHRGAPAHYADEPKKEGEEQPELTLDDVKAHTEYLKGNVSWQREVFAQFVTVAPNELFEDDHGAQRAITDGGEFYDLCHGHIAVAEILSRLYLENTLSEDQKKKLQSRSGSDTGSTTESQPEPTGPTPATAAEPVERATSASVEGVTVPFSASSSGMTAPSSSESVPCGI